MPGTSLFLPFKRQLNEFKDEIQSTLESVLYNNTYSLENYTFDNDFFIGVTKYANYPFRLCENSNYKIYLEGIIYNLKSHDIELFLFNLAGIIELNEKSSVRIYQYLSKVDGDFLITIYCKSKKKIIVINDFLGRLPTYKYISGDHLIISREIRFLLNFIKGIEFDHMGIALGLLLGYPLGERTYFSGIKKMRPGSLIEINISEREVREVQINDFNFEEKENENQSIFKCVEEMKGLFLESCDNRMRFTPNPIISLSGGLDSRAVAAGLCKSNQRVRAATYLDFEKSAKNDMNIAGEIARTLNIPWKVFELDKLGRENRDTLIYLKCGMNHVGMGFIIDFFEKLKNFYWEDIFYFTGDGGDKVLPDLRPLRKIKNYEDLVALIIDSQGSAPLEFVERVTGISRKIIIEKIIDVLSSYEEKTWNMKFVKFLLNERTTNWLFEGEDRNRFFFWTVSPFYSLDFYRYSMNVSDKYKSNYFLYNKFLSSLSKDLSHIPRDDSNNSISSHKFKIYKMLQKFYWDYNLHFLRKKRKPQRTKLSEIIDPKILEDFSLQLTNCPRIFDYFEKSELKLNIDQLNKFGFNNLFTFTTLIEQITKKVV